MRKHKLAEIKMQSCFLWIKLVLIILAKECTADKPNIIFILADDLAWNDVGFHGDNQIPTPNIDALAYSGVILNNYYVNPICTPSRAALMTGYHPIHTGMQLDTLKGAAPYGVPLKFKFLPEYLNDLGYKSMMAGKWHLGSHREVYTPTKRGFKSHVGYWTGHLDYYDHQLIEFYPPVRGWGYDFRRNMSVSLDDYGIYSTDIFTDEATKVIREHSRSQPLFLYLAHTAVHAGNRYSKLQAPYKIVKKFNYIKDEKRRKFAGMLYKLDESVGKVVEALTEKDMLNNTIIVFSTDNGGPAGGYDGNAASNYPLKGTKHTLWEGGVRGSAFIWSSMIKSTPRVSKQMMNIQDWLPTLYHAAGGNPKALPAMDGIDMWDALIDSSPSPRKLFLHNICDQEKIEAVRVGDWKLAKGSTFKGRYDHWFGPDARNGTYDLEKIRDSRASKSLDAIGKPLSDDKTLLGLRKAATVHCTKPDHVTPCHPNLGFCLFNVATDPCEFNNLAHDHPDVVKQLSKALATYRKTMVPPGNKPVDERGDPKWFDQTWTNWLDFYEPINSTSELDEDFDMSLFLGKNDLVMQKNLKLM